MTVITMTDAERHREMNRWRFGAGVFTVYLAYTVVDLLQPRHGLAQQVLGAVLIAGFLWLYIWLLPIAAFSHERSTVAVTLGAMVAVTATYLAAIGGGGLLFGTYLAVAVAMVLPPRVAIGITAAMSAATIWLPEHVPAWDVHGEQWAVGGPMVLIAFAMIGFRRHARTNLELGQAREEIAHLAADQERLRISRDLHDLLGHSLTTITVKSELAAKLVGRDADRAAAEMVEVAGLARQGLADVRATVAGYREMSLLSEIATAREVLTAAGITAQLPASAESVPPPLRELFGWALREGVTNAVRHSRARHVTVTLTERSIEIVDDGVGADCDGGHRSGTGLLGLGERAAAAGARVDAGPAGPRGDGFRLRVELAG